MQISARSCLVALSVAALPALCFGAATLGSDTGINWSLSAADVAAACKSGLASARERIHALESRTEAPATIADGLGAVDNIVADLAEQLSAPTNLAVLAVGKDVRDAATQCNNDYAAFGVELAADPAIYQLAVSAAGIAKDAEERQLAKIYMENGRRAGAALDPDKRAQVTKLLDRLNNLQIEFGRALAEAHVTIPLSEAELASLPPALDGSIKRDATGAHIAVNESSVGPFMENESSADARKRFATAYGRRGGPENVQRLADAVAIRQQLAPLLGFPSWAAYQLDVKMAKTPARASALVEQVGHSLLPKAREEIKALAELKRAAGDKTPFHKWDYAYYERRLESTRYSVDAEKVREYFPVDKVLPAVLDIYSRLLGVRFEALSPAMSWAPGVREYAIYNAADGAAIGWFLLDLYPREGKFEHFAAFPLRSGRLLPDGSYRMPVSAIIGNWPQPGEGKPTLLNHDEVVVFFHEFGHVMHETLSHTRYASLYGIAVRGDFGEAPSQMLENWMWQPAVLKQVSSHVGSGEPLPDDLIAKMIAARHVADGVDWGMQAFLAEYDLQLHSLPGKPDPTSLWFKLKSQLTVFPEIPGTYPEAGFNHLMAGYDGGYYGYLWSKVYAQDMFSKFQEAGLEDPAIGMRYRQMILVPGGSEEPDVLLRRFLGREVSYDPFYEDIGLKAR
ncbi:MAG TPA: M3 family metallopeptidase [Steroidobacteraceae bacterium]|nr:M3 family metallopeptidase [Steroidobacteraceae bacterium]